jgi:hypothetical protein
MEALPTSHGPRAVPFARRRGLVLGSVALAAALGVGARQLLGRPALRGTPAPPGHRSHWASGFESVLHVPYLPGSITLDGDTDDPGWTRPPGPGRTGGFVLASGAAARPYSEARALWGDGYLYLSLYAADEDIESRTDQPDGPLWLDDSFRLMFTNGAVEYLVEVSPKGMVTDAVRRSGGAFDYAWSSGAHVSPELDGTVNLSTDMDEEWVIEMAIPFASLGMKGERGESVGFSVRRCDTPKNAARMCASWGEGDGDAKSGEGGGRLVLD